MKNFLFGVFVWFLLQLMFLTAATNSNMLRLNEALDHDHGVTRESYVNAACKDATNFNAVMIGLLFPITQFSFINSRFCFDR